MRAREAAGEYEVMVDISDADLDLIDDMIYTFNIETEMCWTDDGIRMWFKKPIFYKHVSEGICALGFKVKWEIVKCTENEIVEKEDIDNDGVRQELPEFLTCIKDAKEFYEETSDSDERFYDEETKEIDKRRNMLFTHKFKIRHLINFEKILKFINTNSPTFALHQKDLDLIIQDDKIKVEKIMNMKLLDY
ncbi:hypothetical protein [Bacillus timonensis]|uniref:hypothetical protein n=1 Tax=Bacillus timonensis TaxID=1033734 RepID=UPI000288A32E|nr:hypothetical protein [Bacillus timonensis]